MGFDKTLQMRLSGVTTISPAGTITADGRIVARLQEEEEEEEVFWQKSF